MNTALPETPNARLIMMGKADLTVGFELIGFETWPDATPEQLETLLDELITNDTPALVFLEPQLARCSCKPLEYIQHQGGKIIITEIPSLNAPDDYRSQVEELVLDMLGHQALSDMHGDEDGSG